MPVTKRRSSARWCSVHRTKDPWLETTCSYCHRQMHLHTGHVELVKRRIPQFINCGSCGKRNCLVVALGGKRWELAVEEQGLPAYQLTLDSKSH